jgi:hypothetical protein
LPSYLRKLGGRLAICSSVSQFRCPSPVSSRSLTQIASSLKSPSTDASDHSPPLDHRSVR